MIEPPLIVGLFTTTPSRSKPIIVVPFKTPPLIVLLFITKLSPTVPFIVPLLMVGLFMTILSNSNPSIVEPTIEPPFIVPLFITTLSSCAPSIEIPSNDVIGAGIPINTISQSSLSSQGFFLQSMFLRDENQL